MFIRAMVLIILTIKTLTYLVTTLTLLKTTLKSFLGHLHKVRFFQFDAVMIVKNMLQAANVTSSMDRSVQGSKHSDLTVTFSFFEVAFTV